MALSWNDFKKVLDWGKTAYDVNEGLTKQQQADKNLGDACNGYVADPSAENRARLRKAHEDWYHTPAENVGGAANSALPNGIGDVLDLFGINPVGDWLKGLQDSSGNPLSTDRLQAASDHLGKLRQRGMDDADRARCEKAGEYFKQSKSYHPPRRDPLAIDLDGDGIETVSSTSGVRFDHDGNGIKTGTGWVGKDDGLLVLDRDGNGLIDNGGELFGVDTILANGQKAADGFQALAELDSNGDGQIGAGDVVFQNLRVWRDIDQDGVSQSDEMFSLADTGISSITLTQIAQTQDLGNGNQILSTGSFSRTDGTTGSITNLALAEDRFNSEFVDSIPVSAEAQALPHMGGMGLVRDLSEAATLSSALLGVLSQYSAAASVYDQKNLLDQLVNTWASTAVAPSQGVQYEFTGIQHYINNDPLAGETDAYQTTLQKLHALEIFNADSFAASGVTNVTLLAPQVDLINQGYAVLKDGIYDSLISQTLLKPYFDAITFVGTGPMPHLDYTGVVALLDQKISGNPSMGLAELVDMYRLSGGLFQVTGWNVAEYFGHAMSTYAIDSSLAAVLVSNGIIVGGAENDVLQSTATLTTVFGGNGNDSISGGSENATVYGGDGNDTLTDSNGSDTIEGGAGDDIITDSGSGSNILRGGDGNDTISYSYYSSNTLEGGAGDDLIQSSLQSYGQAIYSNTFTGGAGNDRIVSGASTDTYNFSRGDGQDSINDHSYSAYGSAGGVDKLVFGAGIAASDITVSRVGANLVLKINDPANPAATDQITVENWNDTYQRIEQVQFADGSVFDLSAILMGTAEIDTLNGATLNDVIMGYAGNDTLSGGSGNDWLDGGVGQDVMLGGTGDDTFIVDDVSDVVTENAGEGVDNVQSSVTYTLAANLEALTLTGTAALNGTDNTLNNLLIGNSAINTLTAGSGNDILQGGAGNDILKDTAGTNLLAGGAGSDSLSGASGAELYLGGSGNDTLSTGTGTDILAFNRGDGLDTVVASSGQDNTLSLGGGIQTSDLVFRQSGNDLILDTGTSDSILLQGWYAAPTNHSILTLQMIEDAAADFTPGGGDPLRDNKVEQFNFAGLVDRFDQARSATPGLTSWGLSNALLDFYLGGSDSAAIGGDLAYQYGHTGSLGSIGLGGAQSVLGNAQFGQLNQTINQPGLSDGLVKLSA